jgi:hypothetical protein
MFVALFTALYLVANTVRDAAANVDLGHQTAKILRVVGQVVEHRCVEIEHAVHRI